MFDVVVAVDEQGQRRGRWRSREEADRLAGEYEASTLTMQEFCNLRGMALKTLSRYVTRYRRERTGKAAVQRWVTVEVGAQQRDLSTLSVFLDRGRRIEVKRGFDGETLRRLVVELERA